MMNRNAACLVGLAVLLTACSSLNPAASSQAHPVVASSLVVSAIPPSATQTALIEFATPACGDSQAILKIMPLGDSITFGDGDPDFAGYRRLLSVLLTDDGYLFDFVGSQNSGGKVLVDPDHEGHPGWRITNIREAIDSEGWLENYQPNIILLHIGSNDLRHGQGVRVRDNLSALLDDVLALLPNTHIIVAQIIPTRWGSEVEQRIYNDAIPDIAKEKGLQVSVVDMREILVKSDFMTLYHPNTSGYDKMAQAWESAILALELKSASDSPCP